MWARVESDTITQLYTRPKALTIGFVAAVYYTAEDEAADSEHVEGTLKTPRQGTNYPANIFSIWTSTELEAIGIYEVVMDSTNYKDEKYYINTNQTYTFASDTVTATYGTATAKALADTLYTSEDEDNDLGTEGEVAAQGLKSRYKENINSTAAGLLQPTDWMVIRATEGGTAVPSATTTWRAAVRTKANAMCTAIDGAANVDALAALYVYNSASPPVRPLGDFPILGA